MSKKYSLSLSLLLTFILSNGLAIANVQSPIYTDDIGRAHFLGRGGYSSVRKMEMNEIQADMVNDAVNEFTNTKKTLNRESEDIINNTQNELLIPASSYNNSRYNSSEYYPSGVNESKTIYTDELGRLHFFRKANQIKE